MPFVTDIAGPQRPVQTWPSLAAGVVRRTSTIDTHPAGTGSSDRTRGGQKAIVDLRARDAVGLEEGGVDVLDEVRVRARLAERVIEEKLPAGTADHMAGICAGFAEDASLVRYAKRNDTIPSVHGPVAPPLDLAGIQTEPLRPHGMRRFRRLDLRPD